MTEDEITNAVPIPTTQTAFVAREPLTRNRFWIEGLAAKGLEALNQPRIGDIAGSAAKYWTENLGLGVHDVSSGRSTPSSTRIMPTRHSR